MKNGKKKLKIKGRKEKNKNKKNGEKKGRRSAYL